MTTDTEKRIAKPQRMEVDADAIPAELRGMRRWVVWRWTWKEGRGKYDKPPLQLDGRNAKSNDKNTWCTFGEAMAADHVDGIGFVLTGDGIVGIDLDDCRDPSSGEISEPHASIIREMDSYAEVSPSGCGVKLLVRAKLPAQCSKANHDVGVEVYERGRYFTLTGHRLPTTPTTINERQPQVEWLISTFVDKRNQGTGRDQRQHHNGNSEYHATDDVAFARQALAALEPARADGYGDWLQVGMALHSVSGELLDDWDQWSRQSKKWTDGVCAAKWHSFSGNGVGIGTLIHLAKEDGWKPPKQRTHTNGSSQNEAQQHDKPSALLRAQGRTEAANAKRLVARYGDVIRWCEPWSKWLVWDDKRWKVDDSRQIEVLAKSVVNDLWQEAATLAMTTSDVPIKAVLQFVRASNQAKGVRNLLALARSDVVIHPRELDTHTRLLNVQNGTLDLRTGKLRPHDKSDYLTQLCSVAYEPDAKLPMWRTFIAKVLGDDRQLINYVQRLVGYCLTGSTNEHVLPFLYGTGANGKSVFVSTILALFGEDYSLKAPTDLLLAKRDTHPTERADLFGKRFVACVEVEDGRRLAESLVKELTGGDRVRARRMREDFWEFPPTHKIWLVANHKPIVRGSDHGIWRRIKLVPFTVTIPDDEQDKELPAKLLCEMPGILAWAVEGCGQWQADGLKEPDVVRAATVDYRDEMDLVGRFLEECCIVGPDASVGATVLFRRFKQWCEDTGERGFNQTRFGSRLAERGFGSEKIGGRKVRQGIGLIDGDAGQ